MTRILNDLELIAKKLDDDKWELVDTLYYHVGYAESKEVLIIPTGFITDFASTPLGVHNILPKDGRWSPAAVIHDALYQYKGILPIGWFSGSPMIYSRKNCDNIFLEAMTVLNVSWWQKYTMYYALRFFGWVAWSRPENKPG